MRYPSIDSLWLSSQARPGFADYPRQRVVDGLREAVQEARQAGLARSAEELLNRAQTLLQQSFQPSLVPVINATGVLLHTNLGRSPLSARALEQVQQLCGGYCNLELDLESGSRGHRDRHLHKLLKQMTGCEASLAVNNCAAAMLLIVDEFARGREVLVSRGELVEIGGSFRIPDVLQRGGARLVEVGTTNRTYTRDFASAISPESGMILSTHLSNFAQLGFVSAPDPGELVSLARQHGLVSVLDLGSGLLDRNRLPGGMEEPDILRSVAQGWDLVAFSSDKLLGCAQAGFVLGRAELILRLSRNPWMRALRLDKLRLAALQGGLLDHLLGPHDLPLQAMLTESTESLRKRAQRLARKLPGWQVAACRSSIGGGTTPGQELESWAICLSVEQPDQFARRLRLGNPAILTRIQDGKIWMDLRTILPEQEKSLVVALR